MKKNLLLASLLMGSYFTANAQTTLFTDSFETYDDFLIEGFGDWITVDNDGLDVYSGGGEFNWENRAVPQAYIIFNPEAAEVSDAVEGEDGSEESRDFAPRTGSKYAASWAAVPASASEGNDDWLISPAITLGSTGNTVTFYVKSLSDSYGLEEYNVGIYAGPGTPDAGDFEIIRDTEEAPFGEWEAVTIAIPSDYDAQSVRIGIHNVGVDHYMFMVDDFSVTTTGTVSVKDVLASKFSVSPNPATNVININNAENILVNNVSIVDINGRTVNSKSFDGVASAQINISNLAAGVYMMNIASDKGVITKKIIKN
ncbi:T9SS type A sorting domain-containing protein [Flavobacterium zepuense]|uniref:T9SS type A sorting domain-containing protein n=1 Tax=Flavobacterium zepuense TaxID=2593302 RepID=A0A552V5G0_9FLAO|nr:choice-of-anchor J domain-containing protein [Flavobacterium zepuense]TRW25710.1 T9SS type A sorting domain-containing protein [Flavobacterium zepuense]